MLILYNNNSLELTLSLSVSQSVPSTLVANTAAIDVVVVAKSAVHLYAATIAQMLTKYSYCSMLDKSETETETGDKLERRFEVTELSALSRLSPDVGFHDHSHQAAGIAGCVPPCVAVP